MKAFPHYAMLLLFAGANLQAGQLFTLHKEMGGAGISVRVDGKPFATYVVNEANKPYLWPVYGPTGKAMTREFPMKEVEFEATNQRDHPHHRGITFGHESAGADSWRFPEKIEAVNPEEQVRTGGDSWHEKLTFDEARKNPKNERTADVRTRMLAQIFHREFTVMRADETGAVVGSLCEHLDPAGRRFVTEERRFTFHADEKTRTIDFDQDFVATDGDVRFEDRKDAGLSIRVPASMAVDAKQGGKIINSAGQVDADAWGKPAPWCDYHGPVDGERVGIAFLNHPSSYRFPTRWHVRNYGLFTANPFMSRQVDKTFTDGTVVLKAGERLKLRHRFILHSGDAESASIAALYAKYAQEEK
jgi:hypothetical protein